MRRRWQIWSAVPTVAFRPRLLRRLMIALPALISNVVVPLLQALSQGRLRKIGLVNSDQYFRSTNAYIHRA